MIFGLGLFLRLGVPYTYGVTCESLDGLKATMKINHTGGCPAGFREVKETKIICQKRSNPNLKITVSSDNRCPVGYEFVNVYKKGTIAPPRHYRSTYIPPIQDTAEQEEEVVKAETKQPRRKAKVPTNTPTPTIQDEGAKEAAAGSLESDVQPACFLKAEKRESEIFNAIAKQDRHRVLQLIRDKVDINVMNTENMTPLMYAASKNDEELVKALLNSKADLELCDNHGETALFYADNLSDYKNQKNNVIDLLLDADVNVNAQNKNGYTPLLIATVNGRNLVSNKLISAGADQTIKNTMGQSYTDLLEIALKNNEHKEEAYSNNYSDMKDSNNADSIFEIIKSRAISILKIEYLVVVAILGIASFILIKLPKGSFDLKKFALDAEMARQKAQEVARQKTQIEKAASVTKPQEDEYYRETFIYHITGLKYTNMGMQVFFRFYNKRFDILDRNFNIILVVNIDDVSNAYISSMNVPYSSSQSAVSLGVSVVLFGILGPLFAKNSGVVDVLILETKRSETLVFGLDAGYGIFSHDGRKQAESVINSIMQRINSN